MFSRSLNYKILKILFNNKFKLNKKLYYKIIILKKNSLTIINMNLNKRLKNIMK